MEFTLTTRDTLKQQLDRGMHVQVIDIRPFNAYWMSHVRTAISLPEDLINDRATELVGPSDPIVLYGEDDRDTSVQRSAELLIGRGIDPANISILADGIVGWRGAGFYTASGDEPGR